MKYKSLNITHFVYITISAICLISHNIILILSDILGIKLHFSIIISFLSVTSLGYLLHSVATFKRKIEFIGAFRYFFAMSVNIPMAFIVTWFWNNIMDLSMIVAAPVATVCMLLINFMLSHWAIAGRSRFGA